MPTRPVTPEADEPTPAVQARTTDGRTARAERSRAVIVDALLGLLEEGDLQPTATRIAERAGISLRLIHHHFGDLESLYRAAARREGERVAARVTAIPDGLPLDERIAAVIAQRTDVLEWITPIRRASLLQEPFSDELRAARDAFYAVAEQRVRELFAAELEAVPTGRREATAGALATVLTWGFWNDLRTSGRSPAQAAEAVRVVVDALLGR